MSDDIQNAVNVLLAQIEEKNREINEVKRTINGLCRATGRDLMFTDDQMTEALTGMMSIKSDTFYGIGPHAAMRKFLEMRGKSAGAVSLDEILDAFKRGGFNFAGLGWNDSGRWKNQLSIAISKNPGVFHRLPNDTIGLLSWYPDAAGKRKSKDKSSPDEAIKGADEAANNDSANAADVDNEAEGDKSSLATDFIPKLTDEDIEPAAAAAAAGHTE